MSIEAMKLALEALEDCVSDDITPYQLTKAITALRQAIKQAQQAEPVIDKSAAIRIATALGWIPPRQWVGLTSDEFKFIASKYLLNREAGLEYFQEEVETKLKEKNT